MIRCDRDGDLWVVTIDRPDKANSLTEAMLEELCVLVEAAQEAKALILTGAGKVFSAAADPEAAKAGLAVAPLRARPPPRTPRWPPPAPRATPPWPQVMRPRACEVPRLGFEPRDRIACGRASAVYPGWGSNPH